jgi:hypothetical protein
MKCAMLLSGEIIDGLKYNKLEFYCGESHN